MRYQNEAKFKRLANRLEKQDPQKYATVIERCRNNSYHDFANPDDIPLPKQQMVADLRAVGLEDEAQKVMDGEYDQ